MKWFSNLHAFLNRLESNGNGFTYCIEKIKKYLILAD